MSSFAPTKVPKMHECRKERKRRTYRKSNQRAHHTHTTKMPPKFRQNHDCTLQVSLVHRCQVSTYATKHTEVSQYAKLQGFGQPKTTLQVSTHPTKHPEVSQCAKIRGFGLSKTTLQVSRCLPKPPTDTLQFLNLQNHLSRSQKVTKRHPEFLYTHEIWEFLTIQRPQCTRPNTHAPRSLSGSLIASKIPTFQGKISHLEGLDRPPPAPPRTGGNPSVCVPKNA